MFILSFENQAQDIGLLLKEAQQLEARFNDKEALQKYWQILRFQPSNVVALCKSSELHALLGRRLATKEKQTEYYQSARSYARQALGISPNNPGSQFCNGFCPGKNRPHIIGR
jgi:tetratricopeptide (TPR) repeat protein